MIGFKYECSMQMIYECSIIDSYLKIGNNIKFKWILDGNF